MSFFRTAGALGVLGALTVVAGCSSGNGSDGGSGDTGASGGAGGSASASSSAPVRPATSISLAFAGDIHFENHLAGLATDPHGLDELRSTLGAADFSMADLETTITERGTPMPGKAYTWRAPESALTTLHNAGIDAVTMAMNHAVDFGDEGLEDTLAAKHRAPMPVIGIGKDDAEAYSPTYVDVKGVKVALLAASQVYEETLEYHTAGPGKPGIASSLDPTRLLAEVHKAKAEADVVVAFVHWGVEGSTCPGDEALARAKQLEAAGVDVIIGDHAHRVNGAGHLGRAYVGYGMGNFVYYMSSEPASHTGVLTVRLDVPASDTPRPVTRSLIAGADYTPMLISGDGIPRVQDPDTTARLRGVWEQARECTDATP